MSGGMDDDFESLMNLDGVRRLGGEGTERSRSRGIPEPSRPVAPPPAAPATPDPALAELRATITARDARITELVAEVQAGLERVQALEAAKANAEDQARAAGRERRAVARKLSETQAAARVEVRPLALDDALATRGLEKDERSEVLGRAADMGLASVLQASDPAALRGWLEDHVDLLCGGEQCPSRSGTIRLKVAAARCDVCRGSDIRRAARGFFDACARANVRRVRLVGGSPSYRRQLESLASEDGRVQLKLISGTRNRETKDARQDQRHSDLVVLWGATILDHAVSGLYDPSRGRVLTVPHRGIARMLELVAEGL